MSVSDDAAMKDRVVVSEVEATEIGFEQLEEVDAWQQEDIVESEGVQDDLMEDEEGDEEEDDEDIEGTVQETHLVVMEAVSSHSGARSIDINPAAKDCHICNISFNSKPALTAHLRKAHKYGDNARRDHICSFCNKAFTTSSNLQQHKRLHLDERPFQCSQCNKCFATSTNLKQHVRVHTGDRPFACQYCSKRFATNSNLRQHTRTHTADIIAGENRKLRMKVGEDGQMALTEENMPTLASIPAICLQQYVCDVCTKVYSNSSNLAQHKRTIHPKDYIRRYLCDYCHKSFSLITNLRRHQKGSCPNIKRESVGSEVKKTWACDSCGKVCSTKGNLKSHKFTHSGIKMYECFICMKRFTTNSNLKQHLVVHDGKYNGVPTRRKRTPVALKPDSAVDLEGNETTVAVRTLQAEESQNQEEYIVLQEPLMPPGRTKRPLIVKLNIDKDSVKADDTSSTPKPVLLPPPPSRVG